MSSHPRVHELLQRLAAAGVATPLRGSTWRVVWTRAAANVAGELTDVPGDELVNGHVVARAVRLGYAVVTEWRARAVLTLTASRVEITPAGRERLARPGFADQDLTADGAGDVIVAVEPATDRSCLDLPVGGLN